jgi:hypothetical protein
MTTEIEETSTPKVVNWDVAEERDFEKLRVEMDEHKDKMMELESKAVLLRSKLDKKVELSEANTSSGVKVVALEYKTVKLRVGKMLHDRMVSSMPKPNWFGCLPPPPPNFPKVQSDILDTIYQEFEEKTMKKLGQEGWTLRAVHGRGGTIIHYYFSRPL